MRPPAGQVEYNWLAMSPEELQEIQESPNYIICEKCQVVSLVPLEAGKEALVAVALRWKKRRHNVQIVSGAPGEQIKQLGNFSLVEQKFFSTRQKDRS